MGRRRKEFEAIRYFVRRLKQLPIGKYPMGFLTLACLSEEQIMKLAEKMLEEWRMEKGGTGFYGKKRRNTV